MAFRFCVVLMSLVATVFASAPGAGQSASGGVNAPEHRDKLPTSS